MRFITRDQCPACGHDEGEVLYRCGFSQGPIGAFVRTYYGADESRSLPEGEYRAVRCPKCALLYQAEVGDDDLLSMLYGEWLDFVSDPEREIPGYSFDVSCPRLSRDGHEIMTAAAHLKRPLRELITFDFGMGWAGWARVSVALGCQSYGSELSDNRMRYAAEHGVRTLSLEQSEGLGAHFINSEQVFEHLTEPGPIMAALVKALAPGGILKIGVPAPGQVNAALASNAPSWPDIMPLQPLEHVNCYTRETLVQMGAAHGLEVVTPSLPERFAFLQHGGIDPRKPRNALKEIARPFYTFNNKRILTLWLRKPER